MGNIVEGGGINTGHTRSTVSHSPAIGAGSVARNMLGVNAYDNRTQNYFGGGDMFVGPNGMAAGGVQDLLLLSLLAQAKGKKAKRKKKCKDGHGEKMEAFVKKTYEKQPPHSGVGEVLNQMRTNKAFLNDLREETNGGFLGFGKKLDEAKVRSIASHHFGKDYDGDQIQRASDILVENYSHKHDNHSKWAWIIGVPLAIAGAFALPAIIGGAMTTALGAGGAAAFSSLGLSSAAGATAAGAVTAGGTAWGATLLAGLAGATGAGAAGAALGNAIDDGGDAGLSREDIDGAAKDFDAEHLSREGAEKYFANVHYGKKHDAYKHKKHRGSDCDPCIS